MRSKEYNQNNGKYSSQLKRRTQTAPQVAATAVLYMPLSNIHAYESDSLTPLGAPFPRYFFLIVIFTRFSEDAECIGDSCGHSVATGGFLIARAYVLDCLAQQKSNCSGLRMARAAPKCQTQGT